jgi:RecA/RadA recombinase
MSLMDKIKKNSTIKEASILSKSKFFTDRDMISTSIPVLNVALSAKIEGGFTSGLTMWAGGSKMFKTGCSLLMAKAYMDKYPDAVLMFYDSEFGSPQSYFNSFGIDLEKVLHVPIMDIEQLKFDIMQQITNIERGDKIIILIDSIGNLASKKEVEDALDGKSVADMSRAKQIKSLFRMVTPHLSIKDIPMVVVNHTYKTMELYAKDIVGGGCLVEGTKIKLADGSFKNVEEFLVGDLVKTLDGDKEVTYTWNPETLDDGEPECFEVEFEDGYKVICSDKHKFLINNEWVEAKNLVVGDDVSVV